MSLALSNKRVRDGARTRLAIEREALRLFAAKGVDGASIKDISAAVGVVDAALYRHFASKEEMAQAIFAQHYGALAQAIREIAGRPVPFRDKARALVALFCRLFDEEPDVFAFLLLNQHAHLRFVPKEAEGNAVEALRGLMREAYRRGEITESDADLAAAMALGAVVQPAVFKLYGRLKGPLGAHAEALTRAALAVLRCGGVEEDNRPRVRAPA
ncbi:MAG: TetR/AcrR family transcriptional regulator [Methylobacteriaceae bacterium]|nr:TetR/AcrR family transcriptional regulator [Methylobacteriaceae bacterium]